VYSSGSWKDGKEVWDEICEIRKSQQNRVWCVVRDFKSIRRKKERKSVVWISDYSREIARFNEFIEKSKMMDISMVGRKFIWYNPNGWVFGRALNNLFSADRSLITVP